MQPSITRCSITTILCRCTHALDVAVASMRKLTPSMWQNALVQRPRHCHLGLLRNLLDTFATYVGSSMDHVAYESISPSVRKNGSKRSLSNQLVNGDLYQHRHQVSTQKHPYQLGKLQLSSSTCKCKLSFVSLRGLHTLVSRYLCV